MTAIERAPDIDTARLTLRAHRNEDFPDCAALWGDPEVARHISGRPSTEEETWSKMLRYTGHWALLGFGYWVVRDRQSGRFVGEVGFGNFKREISPPMPHPEAGWAIAPWAQGRGLATEAMLAALQWLESNRGPTITCCMIAPENLASIRLANKCGFEKIVETLFKGDLTHVFERPASRT